ncbi:MAG: PAS domain-containing sensor histidine kinase [Thermodesulfobacteriota bacterium]
MPRADLANALRRLPISQRITQIMLANAFVVVVVMTLAWFGVELFTTQSQRLADLARTSRRVEDVGGRCTGLALFLRQHLEDRSPQARTQAEALANALIEDMGALGKDLPAIEPEFEALAGAVRRLYHGFRDIQERDETLDSLYRAHVLDLPDAFRAQAAALRALANDRRAEGLNNALDHALHLSQIATSAAAALHLGRDPRKAGKARAGLLELDQALDRIRSRVAPGRETEALDAMADLARTLGSGVDHILAEVQQRRGLLESEVDGGQAAIAPAVERILAWNDQRERGLREQIRREVLRSAILGSALSGLLLFTVAVLSWGIARSISRPLTALMEDIRRLAPDAAGGAGANPGDEVAALDRAVRTALALKTEKERLLADKETLIAQLESAKARADSTLQDLQSANVELEALFDNTLVGIAMFNDQGRLLKANTRFAEIFNYEMEDLGQVSAQVLHRSEEEYLVFREMYYKRLGQEELLQVEIPLQRRQGTPIWCQLSAKLVDSSAPDRGLIVVFDDVTGKKKVREELGALNRHLEQLVLSRTRDLAEKAKELEAKASELEEANSRLRELDRMKSDFLSSVSHELRTPLTSVLGFAKLIRREFGRAMDLRQDEVCPVPLDKAERIDKNLDIIVQESHRLTNMINDVLDLTKIEDGRVEWRDAPLHPDRALERAARAAAGMAAEKPGLSLATSLAPDLPLIVADQDRIHQVLMNLVSNAIKFSDTGEVVLAATPDGTMVRFTVSDQGPGIPAEDLERIFDKFHQSSQGDILLGKAKGTGLGLPICKEIVTRYAGRIWAESAPGQGSTFHFTLPAA